MIRKFIVSVVAAGALVACGGGDDSIDLSGSWSGVSTATANGVSTKSLITSTLKQYNEKDIRGSATFSSSANTAKGSISGQLSGNTFSAVFLSTNGQCPFTATLIYDNGTLKGKGQSFSCSVSVSIDISMHR